MHLPSVALETDPKVSVRLIMDSSSNIKYSHRPIVRCRCNGTMDARALPRAHAYAKRMRNCHQVPRSVEM